MPIEPVSRTKRPKPAQHEPQEAEEAKQPKQGQTQPDMTPEEIKTKYASEIDAASRETGISKEILAGMIWQESKGNPNVEGGGLMQIGPNEFKEHGGGDINNPADNIMAGAKYLKELKDQYGSDELALRAYNSGPNGVDVNDPDATPTGDGDPTYVDKVMKAAEELGYEGED